LRWVIEFNPVCGDFLRWGAVMKFSSHSICGVIVASAFWTYLGVAPASAVSILVGADATTGSLVTIDTTTGAGTAFGSIGDQLVGAAYDPTTNTFYARDFFNLYTFDLSGASSLVGTSVGTSGVGITGLTFDSTYSTLYSLDQVTGNFYSVNPATGSASLIGATGITTPLGLSTDSSGNIYAANFAGDLYTINPGTGAATFVLNVGSGLSDGLTEIAFDPSDLLYGVTLTGDLLVADLLGGTVSIGTGVGFGDIRGLTFGESPATVPLPGALPLLGAALGLFGLLGSRRTRVGVAREAVL
jgi:hypothetical protein